MATAAADRLSALPDDALQRVLSFAPAREAAASAVLSRRWRTLWTRTGAVNLDSRPYTKAQHDRYRYHPVTFHAFFRDAQAAVLARRRGGTGLKRLALFLEAAAYRRPDNSGYYYHYNRTRGAEPEPLDGRVAAAGLLADPALARLEELSITCDYDYEREYAPPLASLLCGDTLRVLELHGCSLHPPSCPGLVFPILKNMTLDDCFFSGGCLQAMVDAAPALTSLALVNITQKSAQRARDPNKCEPKHFSLPFRLRCPTATDLVLVENHVSEKELKASAADGGSGIELDMPSLRSFRYRGYPIKLSLTSPAPGLVRVDLDVAQRHRNASWCMKYEPPSRMLTGFSSTSALKLRLQVIEELVVDDQGNEHCGVVLPTFPNLELLELDAEYQQYYNRKSITAMAMAALLSSCPAMSELRLRLGMRSHDYYHETKYGGPYGESVERFERLASMSSAHRAAVQLDGVSDLPDVFTNSCGFRCLQKSLRNVTLQFKAKEVNCFPVQLAKFLAENAMVLEEMHIDDGSQFLPDHLLDKVERWRADAFRRRNLQPDTAAGFRVYQLASPVRGRF